MKKNAYVPEIIPKNDLKTFEKAGYGGRMKFGKKVAVLVVDMERAFVEDRYPLAVDSKMAEQAVKAIKKLLDKARSLNVPIFYTKGCPWYAQIEMGSWFFKHKLGLKRANSLLQTEEAHEIVDTIAPMKGEVVITKAKPSAFFATPLLSYLVYHNVDTLIVTGLVTSGCIRATVVDAFSHNYRVIIPVECVADRFIISHQVSLFDMDTKYADVIPLSDVLRHLVKYQA